MSQDFNAGADPLGPPVTVTFDPRCRAEVGRYGHAAACDAGDRSEDRFTRPARWCVGRRLGRPGALAGVPAAGMMSSTRTICLRYVVVLLRLDQHVRRALPGPEALAGAEDIDSKFAAFDNALDQADYLVITTTASTFAERIPCVGRDVAYF